MNTAVLDEISPSYIREPRIDVTLSPDTPKPQAFVPVLMLVSFERCKPEGVMLPLIFEVQGPSPSSYQRREFVHSPPDSLVFKPIEGGVHTVTLREVAHNRWFGSLRVTVEGDPLDAPKAV
jgi:hypothetical protein